jgi:hypothetical protein
MTEKSRREESSSPVRGFATKEGIQRRARFGPEVRERRHARMRGDTGEPREFTCEMRDLYVRYVTLATYLPPSADLPFGVVCERCGVFLNAITNGVELLAGSFIADVRFDDFGGAVYRDRLISVMKAQGRKVDLECAACGHINRWWRGRTA